MNKKDDKFIKYGKVCILVFGVLSLFNIILLINNKSYALFRKHVQSKVVVEIHTPKEFPSQSAVDTLKQN